MKKLLCIFFGLTAWQAFSQTPNWAWAKHAGSATDVYSTGVCTDARGNTYISGTISGATTFGSYVLNTTNGSDAFLVKYDSAGTVQWAKKSNSGTCNVNSCNSMAIDPAGNIYIAGYFACNIGFGSYTLTPGPGSGYSTFVVKYDPSGNVVWARRVVSTVYGNVEPGSITTDAAGNVYLVGTTESIQDIDLGTDTIHGTGYNNVYMVKYDANGNVLWGQCPPLTGWANSSSIRADRFNGLYYAGSYKGTITFGSHTLAPDTVDRIFLAKYDTAGNVLWSKDFGSDTASAASCLSIDMNSNVYLAGEFWSDTLVIGGASLVNDSTGHTADVFLAKFDSSGNALWATRAGGSFDDYAPAVSADAYGNVYLAGAQRVDLYDWTLLFTYYDTNGNITWSDNAGGGYYNEIMASFVDANGNGYFTGYVGSSVTFGSTTVTNTTGGVDVFLAKLRNKMGNSNCSALFNLYPDAVPHTYDIVNLSQGASTYSWDWGDGTPQDTGAYPSHTYANAGFYTICLSITGPMACSDSYCYPFQLQKSANSMVQVNVISTANAINEIDLRSGFFIFPNPAQDVLSVSWAKEPGLVEVFNAVGKLVYKTSCRDQHLSINIQDLAPGMYLIKAGGKTARFVKE